MRTKYIKRLFVGSLLLFLAIPVFSTRVAVDSLNYYLELAAKNNPQLKSDLMLYKASLEKVPQAGAYPDPELEMGFFIKPMEIVGGKQVADFTLMQMFPWFGTRKAARSEAEEMAKMAYEKFRESRDNLYYEVRSQWYQLCNLNEQYKTTEANIALLRQLEQLALNRFAASSAKGNTAGNSPVSTSTPVVGNAVSGGGMSDMGNTGGNTTASEQTAGTGMSGMGTGEMSGAVKGGMSDVLRVQMERAELENSLQDIRSARLAAEARFNTLLNRAPDIQVSVPDTLFQRVLLVEEQLLLDSILTRNPMITMLEAEGNAYRAKAKMDKQMSYPMIGLGLQYSLINKSSDPMGMPDMNGKDMVMPMVKVSLPLFRRKYNAQQRESRNYWLASELKKDNTRNQLQAEYISAKQQLDDASRKVGLYIRQYALSASTYQLVVQEFAAGIQSLTEVIQVERQMLDYKLKKSEAVVAYNTAVAAIEKLVSTSLNTITK